MDHIGDLHVDSDADADDEAQQTFHDCGEHHIAESEDDELSVGEHTSPVVTNTNDNNYEVRVQPFRCHVVHAATDHKMRTLFAMAIGHSALQNIVIYQVIHGQSLQNFEN